MELEKEISEEALTRLGIRSLEEFSKNNNAFGYEAEIPKELNQNDFLQKTRQLIGIPSEKFYKQRGIENSPEITKYVDFLARMSFLTGDDNKNLFLGAYGDENQRIIRYNDGGKHFTKECTKYGWENKHFYNDKKEVRHKDNPIFHLGMGLRKLFDYDDINIILDINDEKGSLYIKESL